MNLRTAFKVIQADILAGNAAMMESDPGMGKTDMGGKLATWWLKYIKAQDAKARVGLSCFFAATQTPVGATGLPWKGVRVYTHPVTGQEVTYTVTDPAIPLWFQATDLESGEVRPASMFDSVFLIIEEWGQGSPETKRACAEILRIGGTPPFYLPNGRFPSPRLAMSNSDARDGVTKEFDFIIGRRASHHITGDVDIWIEDFADHPYKWAGRTWSVLPVTKAWAKQDGGTKLFEKKPDKQGPWCNPRSVTMADRYVQTSTELNGGVAPVKNSAFVEGLADYMGMGGATSYCSTLQFSLELPTMEDVIRDPDGTPVPAKADLQMLMAYHLAGRCQKEHLSKVIQYMTKEGKPRMPKDMAITFVSSLLRRDFSLTNHPAMEAYIAKNAQLLGVIARI